MRKLNFDKFQRIDIIGKENLLDDKFTGNIRAYFLEQKENHVKIFLEYFEKIDGKNKNSEYRKFKIRTKSTPDDFEMMREVMTRRFSKLEEKDYPDLLLIDGGKGQLNACGQIIYNLGLYGKIELISIAKREEEIFKLGESEPYIFSKREETLKILQRLRDEAHRFGITYHRKLRSKRVISSELDKIEGIGEQRKKNLLKKFGSVAEIKKATYEELKEILPERIIENLQKYLKGDVQN